MGRAAKLAGRHPVTEHNMRKQAPAGEDQAERDVSDHGEGTKTGSASEAAQETMASPQAEAAEEIQTLRAERDRLYDAWLRVTADFDNYRKRIERDRHEFREYALEAVLRQLVPVLDNFERAMDSEPAGLPKAFHEGLRLIHKQLRDVLFKQGLEIMETVGETFDPHLHEAVATEVRSDEPPHRILGEVMKGYKLGKRILRPAMVKVSVRPESDAAGTEIEVKDEDES